MSEEKKSNRELMQESERKKLELMPTGDLIAEMMKIGSPSKASVAARKVDVARFDMLQQELNTRVPARA